MLIQHILVPQGAEYQAVLRGLKRVFPKGDFSPTLASTPRPVVLPIPIGDQPVRRSLSHLYSTLHSSSGLLLIGLGGSLTPDFQVGDVALLESAIATCQPDWAELTCDRGLIDELQVRLGQSGRRVKGVTCDRLVSIAAEKRQLAEKYGASVVEMEGYGVLEYAQENEIACAIVRVISDDCHHDLPDANGTISPEGTLRSLPLAWSMVRQPIAALRLIRGSLQALQMLEQVTAQLFAAEVLDG
ncbi:MAG: hypothetical protein WBA57_25695 [Elainellaceae cyanobacterium]